MPPPLPKGTQTIREVVAKINSEVEPTPSVTELVRKAPALLFCGPQQLHAAAGLHQDTGAREGRV